MNQPRSSRQLWRQFGLTAAAAAAVSFGLFAYNVHRLHSTEFRYLIWNLFLALLPLLVAMRLVRVLANKLWSDWEPMAWSLAWLIVLPNSFYMISDFIHLREVPENQILYAAVMFTAFIYLGVTLGFASLYLVHNELRKRFRPVAAEAAIALTLLVCSFAIYIGRDLRWNSWDVIVNPGGLLFDISDRLLHPEAYPAMLQTVAIFFALLGSLYALMWQVARLLRQADHARL